MFGGERAAVDYCFQLTHQRPQRLIVQLWTKKDPSFPASTQKRKREDTERVKAVLRDLNYPSSIAAKTRCWNSPLVYLSMVSWCYPMCGTFRKGLFESLKAKKNQSRPQILENCLNSLFLRPKVQEKVDRPQSVYKISSFEYYSQTEGSPKTRITEQKGYFYVPLWLQDLLLCSRKQPRIGLWRSR